MFEVQPKLYNSPDCNAGLLDHLRSEILDRGEKAVGEFGEARDEHLLVVSEAALLRHTPQRLQLKQRIFPDFFMLM